MIRFPNHSNVLMNNALGKASTEGYWRRALEDHDMIGTSSLVRGLLDVCLSLLLTESHSFFDSYSELACQSFISFVVWKIKTVETTDISMNYKGSISKTYQVCDFGKALSEPAFSMVNLRGPSLPWRSLNPLTGIRDVPVAN